LEGVAFTLLPQILARQAVQFLVDERRYFI
jgi:hypothetical protein